MTSTREKDVDHGSMAVRDRCQCCGAHPAVHARSGDVSARCPESPRMVRRPGLQTYPAVLHQRWDATALSTAGPGRRVSRPAGPRRWPAHASGRLRHRLRDARRHPHHAWATWLLYELVRQPKGRRLRVSPARHRHRSGADHHGWRGLVTGSCAVHRRTLIGVRAACRCAIHGRPRTCASGECQCDARRLQHAASDYRELGVLTRGLEHAEARDLHTHRVPYSQNIRTRFPTGGYAPIIAPTSLVFRPTITSYSASLWTVKAEGRGDGLATTPGVYHGDRRSRTAGAQ